MLTVKAAAAVEISSAVGASLPVRSQRNIARHVGAQPGRHLRPGDAVDDAAVEAGGHDGRRRRVCEPAGLDGLQRHIVDVDVVEKARGSAPPAGSPPSTRRVDAPAVPKEPADVGVQGSEALLAEYAVIVAPSHAAHSSVHLAATLPSGARGHW